MSEEPQKLPSWVKWVAIAFIVLLAANLFFSIVTWNRPDAMQDEMDATRDRAQVTQDSLNKVIASRDSTIQTFVQQEKTIDSLQRNTELLERVLARQSKGAEQVRQSFVEPKKAIQIAPAKGQLDAIVKHLPK